MTEQAFEVGNVQAYLFDAHAEQYGDKEHHNSCYRIQVQAFSDCVSLQKPREVLVTTSERRLENERSVSS